MDDWFTFDKVKALIALCTFLAGAASYLGYNGHQAKQDAEDTAKQVTNISNYYYKECSK